MRYDATRLALLQPQSQATLFTAGCHWPVDAICAECSRLAYVRFEEGNPPRATLEAALARAGLGQLRTVADAASGTQAFCAVDLNAPRAFIAFRGTQPDDPADIGTDALAVLVQWPGAGKVHEGFRDALDAVWAQLQAWLPGLAGRETWICGHSLGAALATLAAARLPAAHLVNFGSPRVGNAAFAAQFAGRQVHRYVNCCDLVAHLPPAFLGYFHVPGMIYIDRTGAIRPDAGDAFIDADLAVARREYLVNEAWRPGNVGVRDLADHAAVNYVSGVLQDRA